MMLNYCTVYNTWMLLSQEYMLLYCSMKSLKLQIWMRVLGISPSSQDKSGSSEKETCFTIRILLDKNIFYNPDPARQKHRYNPDPARQKLLLQSGSCETKTSFTIRIIRILRDRNIFNNELLSFVQEERNGCAQKLKISNTQLQFLF